MKGKATSDQLVSTQVLRTVEDLILVGRGKRRVDSLASSACSTPLQGKEGRSSRKHVAISGTEP